MSKDGGLGLILRTIEPGRGQAWHGGVTPLGAVRNVSAREAHRRPAGGGHTIWELTLHLAYWKYAVRRRLEGGPTGEFPRSPANWPRMPTRPDEAAWKADRALLAQEHRRFLAVAAAFAPARLGRQAGGGKKWTWGEMIIGILAHDAYHTGQIQLLKKQARR